MMALSTYDTQLLTKEQQSKIVQAKKDYDAAKAVGDTQGMQSAHSFAEAIRQQANYSGLSDGAGYQGFQKTGYTNPVLAGIQLVDTSKLNDWKTAYIQQQNAALEKAYNDSIAQLGTTYNSNKAEYESNKEDAELAFQKNMSTLYDDAYKNNLLAQQQAQSRGLTSSAQGLAMGTSQLAQASRQASELANDRDGAINKINLQLSRLAEDYNINKDTLKKNLDLDKIGALSTAEIQYISSLMDSMQFNANANNEYILASSDARNQYLMQQINNEFTASENQKDRELEERLLEMQLANQRSYRGYSSGGYGSYNSSTSVNDDVAQAYQSIEPNLSASGKEYFLTLYNQGNIKTADDVFRLGNYIQNLTLAQNREKTDNVLNNPKYRIGSSY